MVGSDAKAEEKAVKVISFHNNAKVKRLSSEHIISPEFSSYSHALILPTLLREWLPPRLFFSLFLLHNAQTSMQVSRLHWFVHIPIAIVALVFL
jgi:hypothetical protein